MPYIVTKEDYIAFSGTQTLPDNIDILLNVANDLVGNAVKYNYIDANVAHKNALIKGVCYQVMYYIQNEVNPLDDDIKSFSLGNISVNKSETNESNVLSKFTLSALNSECLLYRGVM